MALQHGRLAPTSDTEREVVAQVSYLVLRRAAPDELVVFPETADEYFADPDGVLGPTSRDEPVGFGLEIALLTPYALAVVTAVVRLLAETFAEAAKDEAKPVVLAMVRRLFGRDEAEADATATDDVEPLDAEQVRRVRTVAYERAAALGLADGQAHLLADAVAGGLLVEP